MSMFDRSYADIQRDLARLTLHDHEMQLNRMIADLAAKRAELATLQREFAKWHQLVMKWKSQGYYD